MHSKVESPHSKLDALKLLVAIAILVGAMVAFYIFAAQPMLIRVSGLLACAAVAGGIALQTEVGRAVWGFAQDSQTEVRRVVWPTRQETMQTTGIVVVMVLFFAVVMWVLDMGLGTFIQWLIGHGG